MKKMAFAVGALDEAIREYLLYRGFTQTLRFFDVERRDDKDKGFRVGHESSEGGGAYKFCIEATRPAQSPGQPHCGLHHAVCVQV